MRSRYQDVAFCLDPSLTSDWQEIGTAAPVIVSRTQVETPEVELWRSCLADALAATLALREGRWPSALAGQTDRNGPAQLAAMARELVEWTDSHAVGGMRWILDVLEAHTGIPSDADKLAAFIRNSLRKWAKLARPRRARIVPLAA